MLNATQAKSITGALQYFTTVLTQGDYYLGTEVNGSWHGKAASEVGLKKGSPVTKKAFKALLEGRHPVTGKKLIQRLRKDRRPGMDLTFSVPKSVSLAWAINNDERIIQTLREVVHETMRKDVEPLVCRRLRSGTHAASKNRKPTANFLYADFLHKTSRPVDGVVDPHLHIHAFVANLTADEGAFYAAELEEIMRQMPALQAKFEARLARRLKQDLGYDVQAVQFRQSRRLKTGWEIGGIDRATIGKFSTRTAQIEAFAETHGIDDPKAKGKLGASTRQKKDQESPVGELRTEWQSRLTPAERVAFEAIRRRAIGGGVDIPSEAVRVKEAVRFAIDHHLYRSSTVEKHRVVGTALEQGVTLLPEEVEAALEAADIIRCKQEVRGADRDYLTTHEVLEAERNMIAFAREGRGTRFPISSSEHCFQRDWLNDQQKKAVHHVLHSKDSVTAVTGGAGTGKSSLMEEAAEAIRSNGKAVFVFAPSTGAREVLQEKGFKNAQTVEHLLRNSKLHSQVKDQVLWIDEAGLLDVRSMNGIFEIAQAQNARVVLSGDTRQHASPRRGEAMRILEREAGLNIARIEAIQRQRGRYKRAIELISRGQEVIDPKTGLTGMLAGFDLLDELGKIKEIDNEDRHIRLAEAYLKADKAGKSTLVVAPTHAEGKGATAEIREQLRTAEAIGGDEVELVQLRSLNLSEAEKTNPASYGRLNPDLVVQFHQNVSGGYVRGERYAVDYDSEGSPVLVPVKGGPSKPIPFTAADRFEVYTQSRIAFAVGDKIRFTLGGKAIDGSRRISNGRIDEVASFDSSDNLKLKSGMTVSRDYGHFDFGYVVTSHAAQGKDRDQAIVAIGKQSLPAVNAKQFYVTASRGKEDLMIFVDDKEAVRRSIQNAGEQLSATELVEAQQTAARRAAIDRMLRQRTVTARINHWWQTHSLQKTTGVTRAGAIGMKNRPRSPSIAPGISRS